jgi:hypothetical protein
LREKETEKQKASATGKPDGRSPKGYVANWLGHAVRLRRNLQDRWLPGMSLTTSAGMA